MGIPPGVVSNVVCHCLYAVNGADGADEAGGGPLRREEEQWRAAVEEERRLLRPAM